MLIVYNVKQGDSMLLSGISGARCCFNDEPLLIDCGLKKANVHSMIGKAPKPLRVVITHADRDHAGGLHDVLSNHLVSRLYIPRYLPEIVRIEDYLRRSAARNMTSLPKVRAGRRVEIAEGDFICSHTKVINPPKVAARVFEGLGLERFSNADLEQAVAELQARGLDLDARRIVEYTPELIDETEADTGIIQRESTSTLRFRERRKFFQGFFVYLAQRLQGGLDDPQSDSPEQIDMTPTRDQSTNRATAAAFQLAANQVSVVLRYESATSFLFTGDADTSVFRRMIARGHTLQAEYLKVPHHGSRRNLDAKSLAAVAPRIALVSHGNRRFGRDPDPHPHKETISLLNSNGVTTHYTNDVKKAGKVIATATTGKTPCRYLDFR